MRNTFYCHSFGCRVNQAEKEELDHQLLQLGFTFSTNNPGIYIIHSCSVTHKAEREAKQLIYQVRKKFPSTLIVVTGCAATNWVKMHTEVPGIDLLVDNQNKEYLASIILKRFADKSLNAALRNAPVGEDKYLRSKRMIVKIQDGCQRFCTYCIVPYLRGLPCTIPSQKVVEMIHEYEDRVQEVILSSINTEAYGYDSKETFIDLIKKIMNNTYVARISFGSIHPWSINDTFFKFYRDYPGTDRIVNFFHIPLQSGSNKMLQLMKRGYTREEFIEKLNILSSLKPQTFISTDVIAGFLEETDKDFEDTYTFLKESPISKFHVFRFSKRQHTAAYHLAKKLQEPDPQIKQKRANTLAKLSTEKYRTFLRTHVGHTFTVLTLEKTTDGFQEGLLDNQIPVLIAGKKYATGTIKNIKVAEYKSGRLFGKIV